MLFVFQLETYLELLVIVQNLQTLLSHKHFVGKKRDTNNWFGKFKTFEQAEKAFEIMRKAIAETELKAEDKMLKENGFKDTKKEVVNEDS